MRTELQGIKDFPTLRHRIATPETGNVAVLQDNLSPIFASLVLIIYSHKFEASAQQVIHMATKNAATIFINIQTLSTMYPSNAHQAGETLPFVTIEDFEAFGYGSRAQSKASVIVFTPLLKSKADLQAWNAYSVNHTNWIAQGRAYDPALNTIQFAATDKEANAADEQADLDHGDGKESIEEISEYVFKVDSTGRAVPEEGDGPFSPIWQMTPVPVDPKMVNFNLASNTHFAEILKYISITGNPILSKPVDAQEFFGASESQNGSPRSILIQPVFDGFEHERAVVGAVAALLPWEGLFCDVSTKS